jgi:hypothetical protein
MRIKQSGVFIALVLASTAAYAEPLDVKLGLWENTITTEMSGTPPVDTSKMSPEQKARFDAAMKARQAQGPRAHVHKSCLTKEKLEREPFQDTEDNKKSCTHTVISSTRTQWHARLQCTKPKRVGEVRMEALSRERIKGTMQMNASDANRAMTVHASIAGRWLGSNCGDIK